MNKIACEMCGGSDLIKQDGVFVCQSCGMQYSVEEAKKMMIEGTVDVQGTVKVDNTAFVEKYLMNARRAKEKEDWSEAERYYNMVEQNDPNNIEAIFYSAYGKAIESLYEGEFHRREVAFKVLINSISILDDNFIIGNTEHMEMIYKIARDIFCLTSKDYLLHGSKTTSLYYMEKGKTVAIFAGINLEFIHSVNNIIDKYGEEDYIIKENLCVLAINHIKAIETIRSDSVARTMVADVQGLKVSLARKGKDIQIKGQIIKSKKREEYWANHQEEKQALQSELDSLNGKLKDIEAVIIEKSQSTERTKEIKNNEQQIISMQEQRSELGMFKGKEKKVLEDKIVNLRKVNLEENQKLEGEIRKLNLEYGDEINTTKNRISEINAKLANPQN